VAFCESRRPSIKGRKVRLAGQRSSPLVYIRAEQTRCLRALGVDLCVRNARTGWRPFETSSSSKKGRNHQPGQEQDVETNDPGEPPARWPAGPPTFNRAKELKRRPQQGGILWIAAASRYRKVLS